jgi:hypothetical protein
MTRQQALYMHQCACHSLTRAPMRRQTQMMARAGTGNSCYYARDDVVAPQAPEVALGQDRMLLQVVYQ